MTIIFISVRFGWTLQSHNLSSNNLALTVLWHKSNVAGAENTGTCRKWKVSFHAGHLLFIVTS
jgi:hypothetical protein